MLRNLTALLALVPMLWVSSALALGLGDIDVRSRLNQRFSASIPVLSAAPAEADSLIITVAPNEVFARSGIERSDFVSNLKFVQVGNSIKVSSDLVVRDPFLNFIIEARWNSGRLLREYTVLLDPPGAASAAPEAATAAAAAPPVRPAQASVASAAPKPAAVAAQAGSTYGPVRANQTLWSIAKELLRDPGVGQEQMLLALYQLNPQAFVGGNINHLLSGSRLTVPTSEQAVAVDQATAHARIAELRAQPAAPREPAPSAPAALDAAKPAAEAPTSAPSVEPVVAAAPSLSPEVLSAAPAPEASPTEAAAAVEAEAPPAIVEVPPPAPAQAAVAPKPAPLPIDDEGLPLELIGGGLIAVLLLVFVALKRRVKVQPMPSPAAGPADKNWLAAPLAADPLLDSRPMPTLPPPPVADVAPPPVPVPVPPPPVEAEPAAALEPELPPLPDDDLKRGSGESVDAALGLGLDGGDPLTEADFHIAYGLYDEAIQMLKKAIVEDPERSELKLKLAETYVAAAKPAELQGLAESLSGQLTQGEWDKLAQMGRSLLPHSALFAAAASAPEAAAPAKAADDAVLKALSVVDFDLDADLRKPEPAAAPPVAVEPEAPKVSSSADLLTDIDLSSFDLGEGLEDAPKTDPGLVEFNLDALEFDAEPEPESPLSAATDEIDTKLDLARAYADMGDAEAAGNLLSEVIAAGSDTQKSEAEALKARLKDIG